MALTQDGLGLSHVDQARVLVASGIRWIQLRIKNAGRDTWLAIASDVVAVAHDVGAIVTINDSVEIALASGADGAHLGSLDGAWDAARESLGPERVLGGTVHNECDARLASASGVLDYVGVGPFRFTATKRDLAPLLGLEGIVALLPLLGALPAWAIGGIQPSDLPALRDAGLHGVAVSAALYSNNRVASNCKSFLAAWDAPNRVTHS